MLCSIGLLLLLFLWMVEKLGMFLSRLVLLLVGIGWCGVLGLVMMVSGLLGIGVVMMMGVNCCVGGRLVVSVGLVRVVVISVFSGCR